MFCFWHCFLSFVLFPISTVCELFFSEQVSCFTIMRYFHFCWSICMSFFGLIFILLFQICFVFDFPFLYLFSFQYQLFVKYLPEYVSCFTFGDIFISAEVFLLDFWSDLSILLLNMFCFWHCFISFHLFPISTVLELFFSEKLSQIMRYFHFCWSIGISFLVWSFYFIVKYVLFWHCFSLFVLFPTLSVDYFFFKKYLVSDCEIFSFLLKYWY